MNFESVPHKKMSIPEVAPASSDRATESVIEKEKIDSATIELNGEYFTASNHLFALLEMQKQYPNWQKEELHPKDGFLTTHGRFVDRNEAFKLAEQAGQLDSDESSGASFLQSEYLH